MSLRASPTVAPRLPSIPAKAPETQPTQNLEKNRQGAISPTFSFSKDARAYEHDRQRVKKAAELVKMRMRKSQSKASKLHMLTTVPSEKTKRLNREDVDIPDLPLPTESKHLAHWVEPRLTEIRNEVKLADLIVSRKPRKSTEGDFEVVPHVRSVIVLDDSITPDIELDEPWEHVEGVKDHQPTAPALSYAKIVSALPI